MYKSVLMTVLNLVQGQMYSKNLADREILEQVTCFYIPIKISSFLSLYNKYEQYTSYTKRKLTAYLLQHDWYKLFSDLLTYRSLLVQKFPQDNIKSDFSCPLNYKCINIKKGWAIHKLHILCVYI